jgi:hypothetical protein
VPTFAVVLADGCGGEEFLPREGVGERRLSDAGRPQQGDRAAGGEVGAHRLDPVACGCGDRVDGHAEGDRLDLQRAQLPLGAEVGLRQQDDRLRAALPRGREVALEPAQVEVLVQRHDQEDGVDVRGQHLLLRGVQRDLARELRGAREDVVDGGRVFVQPWSDRDPVAHCGEVAGSLREVCETACRLGAQLAELREEGVGAAVLRGDAGGDEPGRGVRRELRRAAVRPAEVGQ